MARSSLHLAAPQRGAAVFVVMMAILLLSGMGMWSMHSAALVDRAAGYERASLQAQYVAELGLVGASAYLSLENQAAINYKLGERAYVTGERCQSIPTNMPTGVTSFCKTLWRADIETSTITGTSLWIDNSAQGSFSPFAQELQGDFTVEMTSPREAFVPGTDLSLKQYKLVTLTSYGTVRPHTTSAVSGNLCAVGGTDSTAQNSAAGRIAVRSHAIIGPIK